MALYEVVRNDEVGPGEFVSAVVIARGTNQARGTVETMSGVAKNGANLDVHKVDTSAGIQVLSVYYDERDDYDTTGSAVFTDGSSPFAE